MIEKVEHAELKMRHFRQAQYWKWHFCDDYDVIIQQHKVGYISNMANQIEKHCAYEK